MQTIDGEKIPDHVILADWLKSRGYSHDEHGQLEGILVMPETLAGDGGQRFDEGAWKEGTPSPNYPLLERLYTEVGYLFKDAGLITEETHNNQRIHNDIIY
ncbi:MAG: hypothetical protein GF317_20060, partial [Candidatus Lokiarchaeota archaeon]|nr:hypothetical protein [Candidatus Lokiarchaeota archaeon]MBD3201777.1 hypothetical protein [Candidatus Lokiarchaeota archaeon]